jgi:hypothetical protein
VFACGASAADIDGKWTFESKAGGGKKGGGPTTIQNTLDLKSAGNALTGKAIAAGKKRDTTAEIKDGKIEGNRISFVTVVSGRKQEQKFSWTGTLQGGQLQLTRTRDGAKKGQSYTAKKI